MPCLVVCVTSLLQVPAIVPIAFETTSSLHLTTRSIEIGRVFGCPATMMRVGPTREPFVLCVTCTVMFVPVMLTLHCAPHTMTTDLLPA